MFGARFCSWVHRTRTEDQRGVETAAVHGGRYAEDGGYSHIPPTELSELLALAVVKAESIGIDPSEE